MNLRLATLADLPTLLRWDAQPHVADSGGDDDEFDWAAEIPRNVGWREILVGEVAGGSAARPVGVVVSIDPAREETRYWGAIEPGLRALDIWIGDAADLGRGYGTQLMHRVLDRCFADPSVAAVLVDPLETNVRAHRFYERIGFRRLERRRFGNDDCIVLRIDRRESASR